MVQPKRQTGAVIAALFAFTALPSRAADSDIPKTFTVSAAGQDYIKREVMIPMRDGVKLYTVIVLPKGASNAPILLTRTPYNASARTARNKATSCSCNPATSASSRTSAANTNPKAIT